MRSLSFYEHVGIVIPGSVLLFGIAFFFPSVGTFFAHDEVSLGGLGVFVLLSYAAGQLVAAGANMLELLWLPFGGMPSDWVLKPQTRFLSADQIARLERLVRGRLRLPLGHIAGMDRKRWFPISRQIYSDVMAHGKPARIDTFNGNYGLNRGLAVAAIGTAIVDIISPTGTWTSALALALIALAYLYRAYRFGVHYARELYAQFLVLPEA